MTPSRPIEVLVSGAVVLDLLGRYERDFDRYEWDAIPQSLAFDATAPMPELIESYGGCAANVAYSLACLGVHAVLISAVGRDFDLSYRSHLLRAGVDLSGIHVLPAETRTPRSVTITDKSCRQFSFWASNDVKPGDFPPIADLCVQHRPKLVIVASNHITVMADHLLQGRTCRTMCLWAPGGDLVGMDRAALEQAWASSNYIVINESEWRAALSIFEARDVPWPSSLQAVFVTRGAAGSTILRHGRKPVGMRPASPAAVTDPTGCGDAFTAGVAWGLMQGSDLVFCAHAGSCAAAVNLENLGTQNHPLSVEILRKRMRIDYGIDTQEREGALP